METIKTITRHGLKEEVVYNIYDYPYKYPYRVYKSLHYSYIGTPATFDIETSKYIDSYDEDGTPIWKSFLYQWQFCMNGNVCFGRTWDEYKYFYNKLADAYRLGPTQKLVVFVHNLSFEFQHMLYYHNWEDVFAQSARDVITARSEFFEYRCSYHLSNMTLEKYCENSSKCEHIKASGDLDYSVLRLPSTVLTDEEKGYCYNDVKGLEECILQELEHEKNITTLPLTSTGFVRRDCRKAMRKNRSNHFRFLDDQLTYDQYILHRHAFRGGNTCSNRHRTGTIEYNVNSYDISSSYPYAMLRWKYPDGKWLTATPANRKQLLECSKKFATIGYYYFENIQTSAPMPYIPRAKCLQLDGYVNCNGRILQADRLVIALTDVDYAIIARTYEFDVVKVHDFFYCHKKRLPKELIDTMMEYYIAKATLKGVPGKEYEYAKSKNKLNSVYGMTVSNPVKHEWKMTNGEWLETSNESDQELLLKYYQGRNNFLSYQWGVWVAAYGRMQLQEALDIVCDDAIYCDTDSVKYINNHDDDFKRLNEKIIRECEESGIVNFVEVNGKKKYLGIWDFDGEYSKFVTLGAKKYCVEKRNGHLETTVAGLGKKQGSRELERTGGIDEFKIGKVFLDSGRTVAHYHEDRPHYVKIEGENVLVSSGVAITDTTYTLGVTDEYLDIISKFWKKYDEN